MSDQQSETVELRADEVSTESDEKKPYVAPELTKLGLLRASTQWYFQSASGAGILLDVQSGPSAWNMSCRAGFNVTTLVEAQGLVSFG